MPTAYRVRPATRDQYDAIADLTAGTYAAEGWAEGGYEPVLRDVAGRAEQAHVLVAVERGRLLGAVAVATRGGPFAELAGPGEAVLRMLVTDPADRGRGVAEALVQACLDAARADGCSRMRLATQPEMAAARRLYDRLGFVRTPELDWRPVPEVPLLAYAREL